MVDIISKLETRLEKRFDERVKPLERRMIESIEELKKMNEKLDMVIKLLSDLNGTKK